jgi:hypothetical protein
MEGVVSFKLAIRQAARTRYATYQLFSFHLPDFS